jgi:hypothetical protein
MRNTLTDSACRVPSARRNELLKLGVVRQAGKRPCRQSGVIAMTWEVVSAPAEQMALLG